MSDVVHHGGASTDPPDHRSHLRPRGRSRVGAAIAFVFSVFAFIVVACSGGNGENGDDIAGLDEQGQRVCTPDGEGCGPPPRDPCGHDGEACCPFNNFCQSPFICFQGSCTTCGVPGGPCCAPNNTCQSGSACQNGACVRTCGAQGLACCNGTTCDSGLSCLNGTCGVCGRPNQPCCPGSTCNSGSQCTNGTCRACGGNNQPCCASGAACGSGLACTGGTCQVTCGYAFGPCCSGLDWQRCSVAGSGYACNNRTNRCDSCGNAGQLCCVTGSACTFNNTCVPGTFGNNVCTHCGRSGEPCCNGISCNSGLRCSSGSCAPL